MPDNTPDVPAIVTALAKGYLAEVQKHTDTIVAAVVSNANEPASGAISDLGATTANFIAAMSATMCLQLAVKVSTRLTPADIAKLTVSSFQEGPDVVQSRQ